MISTKSLYVAAGLALLLCLSCGKSEEQRQAEEAARKMADAGKEMEAAMKGGAASFADAAKKMNEAALGAKVVEPVDFRVLKSLLPEGLPGMRRENATAEKTGMMGIQTSVASADYNAESGAHIDIKITDLGSVSGFAAMAAYGWAMADIDRETETGYEKTTTIGGHRAYEKWNSRDKDGDISVIVGNRFLVEVDGSNVQAQDLRAALGRVDLAKLDGMKMEGVQK